MCAVLSAPLEITGEVTLPEVENEPATRFEQARSEQHHHTDAFASNVARVSAIALTSSALLLLGDKSSGSK